MSKKKLKKLIILSYILLGIGVLLAETTENNKDVINEMYFQKKPVNLDFIFKRGVYLEHYVVRVKVKYQMNHNYDFILTDESDLEIKANIPLNIWKSMGYHVPIYDTYFYVDALLVKNSVVKQELKINAMKNIE